VKIDLTCKSGEDIASEIRNIKQYPCTLEIYDRVLILNNRDEAMLFSYGIEIGFFVQDERWDAATSRK
jgi:hypothetical protein